MSKLYSKYLSLKKENDSTIYLFKSGIFYLFIEDDAKTMSPLLQLKLSNLSPTVFKCGFPVTSLEKYLPLLEKLGKKIEIIDLEKNLMLPPKEFVLTQEIRNFIFYLSSQDSNTLSIKEAYRFIDEVVTQSKNFLEGINNE